MRRLSQREVRAFRNKVRRWYRVHGRHDLPWRHTVDPYRVLVSECMLQQTQVSRVLPKYEAFLARFPTVHVLAAASVAEVLRAWQGLGYNRRALALKRTAEHLVRDFEGEFPLDVRTLETLPGIGPYTARAVLVFAFNIPHVLIETNIRTVVYERFFPHRAQVREEELTAVLEDVLPKQKVREWYWALMDYGSAQKSQGVRRNRQNPQYRAQSRFKGSDREIRGALLKVLSLRTRTSRRAFDQLSFSTDRIEAQLHALIAEGLVVCSEKTCRLAD